MASRIRITIQVELPPQVLETLTSSGFRARRVGSFWTLEVGQWYFSPSKTTVHIEKNEKQSKPEPARSESLQSSMAPNQHRGD